MFLLALIAVQYECVELRQLVYLDAVVRHGGFTRAAEHLRVAQPAVSVQIRRLEAELGARLLHRTTRTVALTQAGELVLRRARRAMTELDAVRDELAGLAGGLLGRVRIGAIQALDPFDLPAALAAFHRQHPGVELALGSGALRRLLDGLDHGELDLAIGPMPPGLPARYARTPLFTDELVLATPPDHPLAGTDPLPLAALRDEPFVCLPADSGLRAILDRLAGEAGFTPRVPFESSHLHRLRDLAAHGLGVALVARSVAEAPGPPVAVHSVDPGPQLRPVGLLHRTDVALGAAAEACRAFLAGWMAGTGSADTSPAVDDPAFIATAPAEPPAGAARAAGRLRTPGSPTPRSVGRP
ncbi:LysR family transcriptional regulator [Pseudonocardia cypriaca]|uniref:LysR family transcriptional regulator n=1 Tax=Pseudonocardia cypriaca TaxID=882449 RepID=A0A543GHV2_9PSEU|nr:LysR family transcriptional regulator [Pseudonocardia cypriaca]